MKQVQARIIIPADIAFADLALRRDSETGAVGFRWTVIERICEASGLDVAVLGAGPEDNVAALIMAWYDAHRARGGKPDPVADDLIAEAAAEDALGGGFSHQPGRA